MKQFVSFVIKETKHISRDKRTMLILFGMPVVMMLLFGFAISTDVKNVRLVVVTSSADNQTSKIVEALSANSYFEVVCTAATAAEAEQFIRNQKADMAIAFAPDFASKHAGVQIITDGADPNMAQMYENYATQIVMQHVSAQNGMGIPAAVNTKLLYNPQMRSSYNFVPGIMGMLLMLICAMMTSISIVREKESGTMEVLLVSPMRPIMIIIAKAVPYMALAFVILASILVMSKCVLEVPLQGSLAWIVAVSGLYIMVALSLGLLISTVARTQLVALLASAMMLILPCILLSGMMFPIESMPRALQVVSAIMPPRYYISAMRKLMIVGAGIGSVKTEVAVLAGMAVLLLSLALMRFSKRLE